MLLSFLCLIGSGQGEQRRMGHLSDTDPKLEYSTFREWIAPPVSVTPTEMELVVHYRLQCQSANIAESGPGVWYRNGRLI